MHVSMTLLNVFLRAFGENGHGVWTFAQISVSGLCDKPSPRGSDETCRLARVWQGITSKGKSGKWQGWVIAAFIFTSTSQNVDTDGYSAQNAQFVTHCERVATDTLWQSNRGVAKLDLYIGCSMIETSRHTSGYACALSTKGGYMRSVMHCH